MTLCGIDHLDHLDSNFNYVQVCFIVLGLMLSKVQHCSHIQSKMNYED
jgi:hypothetical protein